VVKIENKHYRFIGFILLGVCHIEHTEKNKTVVYDPLTFLEGYWVSGISQRSTHLYLSKINEEMGTFVELFSVS